MKTNLPRAENGKMPGMDGSRELTRWEKLEKVNFIHSQMMPPNTNFVFSTRRQFL